MHALALALTAAALTPVAGATEPSKKRVVMVAPRTDPQTARAATAAVRAQLSDIHIVFEVQWVDGLPPSMPAQVALARGIARARRAFAVFWFDLSASRRIFLHFSEAGGERTLVRNLPDKGGTGRFEALAVIVRGSVRAMLEGGRIAVSRPTRPTPRVARKKRRPPRRWNLGLELAYDYQGFATDIPATHGLLVAAVFHLRPFWAFLVAYRVSPPFKVRGELSDTSLTRHPISLGGRLNWMLSRFRLGAAVALTLDWVDPETTNIDPRIGKAPRSDRGSMMVELALLLHAEVRLARRFRLFLDAGIDVALHNVRYHAHRFEMGEIRLMPLITPWVVRPRISFGLAVDIL